MTRINRRNAIAMAALLGMAGIWSGTGYAQDYPAKPIKLIIPYAAGGITDVVHRVIADAASQKLGQPIIVENLTGAGGQIGARAFMTAAPDGYTIGVLNSGMGVNAPLMDKNFKAEVGKDYVPITRTVDISMVLTTSPKSGFKSARELLDYAKANPNKVTFGSSGTGGTGHLTIELIKSRLGIEATHVPYRGEAPLITDLTGGQVTAAVISYPKQLAESGQLLPLAVAAPERFKDVPDLPTFAEQGVDIVASAWQGFVAPAGTPDDIVAKLNAALAAAVDDPAVAEKLKDINMTLTPSSPQGFADYIKADIAQWEPVFESAGLKAK
jgi:tripartite-type tricarboxylate transporter receptor subunit TctC